jgi:putative peptidoglycan lipid II flippase
VRSYNQPAVSQPSSGRRIAVAGAIWTGALLASRLMGLVRDAVLGSTLGVGPTADAYAAAFRIPDNVLFIVSGGALGIVFIPMFTAFLANGEEERAWRAFSLVANFILLLAGIVVPIAWWFAPELGAVYLPDFTPDQAELFVRLTRIILPAQVFHLLSALLGAALLARDKHAIPALAPLVYSACVIAGGLIGRSAEGFAWGTLVGALLGPFGMPLVACLQSGLRWRLVLDLRDRDFRTYLVRALPIMLSYTIVGADDTVLTYFGASVGTGVVATLNYAKTLMKVPIGVFGMAMGQAAYPTLTRLCVEGKLPEAYATLLKAARVTLVLALGSQVILTVAAPETGTLVYGAGRIAPDQLAQMGLCLGVFSLALGAWSVYTVLARGFYARARTWVPTLLGFAALLLALPVYAGLGKAFGAPGLAAASSAALIVYVAILAALLHRELSPGAGTGLLPFLLRALPATALGIGAGVLLRPFLGPPDWTRLDALLRFCVLGGVGGGVFVSAAWTFGVGEIREIGGMVMRRVRR